MSLYEWGKNTFGIVRSDARSLVDTVDINPFRVDTRAQLDGSAIGTEVDRIGQQIVEYHSQLVGIQQAALGRQFVDLVLSAEGQKVLAAAGFGPAA